MLTTQSLITEKKHAIEEFSSYQYDLMARIPKNRPIFAPNLAKMKLSVMRHGVTRDLIVVWDNKKNKYLILDGQHLFEVIKEFNLPFRCRIMDCESDEDITRLMIDLNNTSKSWKLNDYIHSWAEGGNKHYRLLKNAINLTYSDMQISIVIQAYTMQQSRLKATKMVKDGSFQIVNKIKGDEIIECVCDCSQIIPNTRQMNEALVKLILKTESYNHKHMIKRLKAVVNTYVFSTNESKMYQQLLSIYNNE